MKKVNPHTKREQGARGAKIDKVSSHYGVGVKIDKQKCLGCGVCISLCPEVFELKDGKSQVKEKADLEKHKDCIKGTIDSCPVSAIEITNDN